MVVKDGWRTSPRPPDWHRIRRGILQRDGHRCTWFPGGDPYGIDYMLCYTHPYRCTRTATDVDHITSHDDHTHTNLRSLCRHHHASKSASQAGRKAQDNKYGNSNSSNKKHPGLR